MKTILVVEDEVALQDALKQSFEGAGYTIMQAFDGEEAATKLTETKPDLVLLDLILPKKHGFDVLKEMKSNDTTKHIPVLVLTNLEESEDVMKSIELGARGYLIKANYALKEVLAKVKEVLGE
ncbi:MAG: response regulator [Patescibacteria group bacterium]